MEQTTKKQMQICNRNNGVPFESAAGIILEDVRFVYLYLFRILNRIKKHPFLYFNSINHLWRQAAKGFRVFYIINTRPLHP